jgi:hypothetical protein
VLQQANDVDLPDWLGRTSIPEVDSIGGPGGGWATRAVSGPGHGRASTARRLLTLRACTPRGAAHGLLPVWRTVADRELGTSKIGVRLQPCCGSRTSHFKERSKGRAYRQSPKTLHRSAGGKCNKLHQSQVSCVVSFVSVLCREHLP